MIIIINNCFRKLLSYFLEENKCFFTTKLIYQQFILVKKLEEKFQAIGNRPHGL